jgi:hypothetical protein
MYTHILEVLVVFLVVLSARLFWLLRSFRKDLILLADMYLKEKDKKVTERFEKVSKELEDSRNKFRESLEKLIKDTIKPDIH